MNTKQNISLFLLRISMGWLFFHAGIVKVLDPEWSSAGFLKGAKMLTGFYAWLASPDVLPCVDFLNEWGLTLLGVSLILGLFVRLSAPLGALLMLLYWIPRGIIHPDPNSFIVDEHIIFIFALCVLYCFRAGKYWGLDAKFSR